MNEVKEIAEELTKLGLTEYQAKVYYALVSLGPSGVSEINHLSNVPRTKIYETLEELITQGVVEFQPGRPLIYRAVRPAILIKRLSDDFLNNARKAEASLESRFESITNLAEDLVWIVRGDITIRRKLAEIVSTAKQDVLALESYPPTFLPAVKSVLKAATKRNVRVRAVCLVGDKGVALEDRPEYDLIEYRTFYPASSRRKTALVSNLREEDQFLRPLTMTLSGPYGIAIIDEVESFVMIPNLTDGTRSIGFSAKIPGVSLLQKIMFERLITIGSRMKVR